MKLIFVNLCYRSQWSVVRTSLVLHMRLMRIIVSLIYMADTKKHIRTQMSSYIYPHLRQESQTEIDLGRKLNLPVIYWTKL